MLKALANACVVMLVFVVSLSYILAMSEESILNHYDPQDKKRALIL